MMRGFGIYLSNIYLKVILLHLWEEEAMYFKIIEELQEDFILINE